MRTCLTEMSWTMTMPLVGETEAGSAQVQPVRDSRTKATDGRRDDGVMPVIPSSPIPSRAFLCLKKPPRRRRGKELIVKGVCPFHAEPLQFCFANKSANSCELLRFILSSVPSNS